MRIATVALALQLIDLPQGRKFSHHTVFLTKDGEEGEPVDVLGNSVRFEELEPGTYFATACSLADDGSFLTGPFVSEPITIHGPIAAQAELVQSLIIHLEPDMNDTSRTVGTGKAAHDVQNPDGRTGNPNDPVDMAAHPDADVPIGGKLSNGETQTEATKAAIAQAATGAYARQGNAAGHADQKQVADEARTTHATDGTPSGPSDSH